MYTFHSKDPMVRSNGNKKVKMEQSLYVFLSLDAWASLKRPAVCVHPQWHTQTHAWEWKQFGYERGQGEIARERGKNDGDVQIMWCTWVHECPSIRTVKANWSNCATGREQREKIHTQTHTMRGKVKRGRKRRWGKKWSHPLDSWQ